MNDFVIDAIVGIDPGANGGIVCWRPNHRIMATKMPKDLNALRDYLLHLKETARPILFLEKLSVRPDDITVEGGGANIGKLYRIQRMIAGYEQLKAVIDMCGVPYVMVHPMKWQSTLNLRVKGEEKAARKARFKEAAAKLYPELKATLWSADATLIMHFGRHVLKADPYWVMSQLPQRMKNTLF